MKGIADILSQAATQFVPPKLQGGQEGPPAPGGQENPLGAQEEQTPQEPSIVSEGAQPVVIPTTVNTPAGKEEVAPQETPSPQEEEPTPAIVSPEAMASASKPVSVTPEDFDAFQGIDPELLNILKQEARGRPMNMFEASAIGTLGTFNPQLAMQIIQNREGKSTSARETLARIQSYASQAERQYRREKEYQKRIQVSQNMQALRENSAALLKHGVSMEAFTGDLNDPIAVQEHISKSQKAVEERIGPVSMIEGLYKEFSRAAEKGSVTAGPEFERVAYDKLRGMGWSEEKIAEKGPALVSTYSTVLEEVGKQNKEILAEKVALSRARREKLASTVSTQRSQLETDRALKQRAQDFKEQSFMLSLAQKYDATRISLERSASEFAASAGIFAAEGQTDVAEEYTQAAIELREISSAYTSMSTDLQFKAYEQQMQGTDFASKLNASVYNFLPSFLNLSPEDPAAAAKADEFYQNALRDPMAPQSQSFFKGVALQIYMSIPDEDRLEFANWMDNFVDGLAREQGAPNPENAFSSRSLQKRGDRELENRERQPEKPSGDMNRSPEQR